MNSGPASWQQLSTSLLGTTPVGPRFDRVTTQIWEKIGYHPTPAAATVHEGRGPDGAVVDHRLVTGGIQSGKSTITAAEVARRLPWLAGSEVWFVGPDFRQSRKECEYLIEYTRKLGLFDPRQASLPNSDAPWSFTLRQGTVVKTFSATNYRKMAGSTPGFVALVEPGQMPDAQPLQIALARAGLRGVPLFLVGTLEGSTNWYANLAARWEAGSTPNAYAWKLPTWTNTHLFPGGRYDPRILAAERDPEISRTTFLERYAGERCAPPGLVFGPTAHHPGFDPLLHVRPLRRRAPAADDSPDTLYPDSAWPLYLAIDPGWDHPYGALLCTLGGTPKTLYILGELYERGLTAPRMIALARATWGELWGQIALAVLDPASRQHHGETDYTHRDYWAAPPPVGAGLAVWAEERVPIQSGTNTIRKLLELSPASHLPRLLVDPSCVKLQYEFREGYRNLIDLNGQSIGRPIDRYNDLIKPIHYICHVLLPGLSQEGVRRARKGRKSVPWD